MQITYTVNPVKHFDTMTFRTATDLLAVSLEEVASVTGRSYNTVLAYRNGARKPPPEVLEKLAAFMRKHSTELAAAADELEG